MNYYQSISLMIRFNYIKFLISKNKFFNQLYDNKYTIGNIAVHDPVLDYVDALDNKFSLLPLIHSSS